MRSANTHFFFACRQQIWWQQPSVVQTIWQEFTDAMASIETTKNVCAANVRHEPQLWKMADRNSDGLDAEMRKRLTAEDDKRGELHADERCISGIWA